MPCHTLIAFEGPLEPAARFTMFCNERYKSFVAARSNNALMAAGSLSDGRHSWRGQNPSTKTRCSMPRPSAFRRQGLNAASVRDLAEEMGIAGPSLYNTFGCKRDLFVQALERYVHCGMRSRFAELEQRGRKRRSSPSSPISSSGRVGGADRGGCLLVNTAMEVDPLDAELAARVADYLGEIEAFLRRNLAAARRRGRDPARPRSGGNRRACCLASCLG